MTEWYYRTATGEERGPIGSVNLKKLTQRGEIGRETEIRKGAEGRWITANKFKGLLDEPPNKTTSEKTGHPVPTNSSAGEDHPQPLLSRSKPSEPLVQRPLVDAEPHDDAASPVTSFGRVIPIVVDPVYNLTLPDKQRSPLLLVGAGVGGTLLVVGLVVAFAMLVMKDENKVTQEHVAQTSGDKNKDKNQNDKSLASKNDSPASSGTKISPSLSEPETTIKGYLSAGTWEERLPYVLNADNVRPKMAKLYHNQPAFNSENFLPGTVLSVENRNAAVGGKCTVSIDVSTSTPDIPRWTFILVRTPEGFKVDWEVSLDLIRKDHNDALQAKLRELNPVIDMEVLQCKQANDYTEVQFRLTNRSKALLSYVAVTMSIHNVKDEYLGSDYTNETNVRAGQSILKSFSFNNVRVEEVASWQMGVKSVVIDQGDGTRTDATTAFSLNEQLAGSEKGYHRKPESLLNGHWRDDSGSDYYFSSDKRRAVFGKEEENRSVFSVNVNERNYSTRTFQLRLLKNTGGGMQCTFAIKDQTTIIMHITHVYDGGKEWRELKDEVKDKLISHWTYVDEKESP